MFGEIASQKMKKEDLLGDKMKTCRIGQKYHIDTDFEHERLVDNVTVLECPRKNQKKVLVHSPVLRADILISKKDLFRR